MSLTRQATTMAALIVSTAAMLAAAPQPAEAATPVRQPGNFGFGLTGGSGPSGLSLKYFQGQNALQGIVGINFRTDFIRLNGDYLYEGQALASGEIVELAWNIGAGLGVGLSDDFFGIYGNGVAGLEFNFQPLPLDIVLEWRPSLRVFEPFEIDLISFNLHVRVYLF